MRMMPARHGSTRLYKATSHIGRPKISSLIFIHFCTFLYLHIRRPPCFSLIFGLKNTSYMRVYRVLYAVFLVLSHSLEVFPFYFRFPLTSVIRIDAEISILAILPNVQILMVLKGCQVSRKLTTVLSRANELHFLSTTFIKVSVCLDIYS